MADVQFFPPRPPTGPGVNTNVEFSATPEVSDAVVDYYRSALPDPVSLNPSENGLVYCVSSVVDTRTIEVTLVGTAPNGGEVQVAPQLDLAPGPLANAGIVGKFAVFIAPTGGTPLLPAISPLKGTRMLIAGPTAAGTRIVFTSIFPSMPTLTDRLVIESMDRALRRTPLVEVVLS